MTSFETRISTSGIIPNGGDRHLTFSLVILRPETNYDVKSIEEIRLCTESGAAIWRVTLSTRLYRVTCSWPLCTCKH